MLHEADFQKDRYIPDRLVGPADLTPAERILVGSTESKTDATSLLTADFLHDIPEDVNRIRSKSEIVKDKKGLYLPPKQLITAAITDTEATIGVTKAGLVLHAQLPPLDTKGRVSGLWELVLVKRKGGQKVVTDPQLYREFISQERLADFLRPRFSIIPPRESRPFPRLALSVLSRRGS